MTVTVRFAPSPTGKLHVGNVRAALWNWLFARQSGGKFILRIDDTDRERSTKAYEDLIRTDLAWLGLFDDDSVRQSARFDQYDAAVEKLKSLGLLYACYETSEELDRKRKLQRARSLPPVYDRAGLAYSQDQIEQFEAEGRKPHWRFKLSHKPIEWNDLIRGHTVVDTVSVSDPVLIREDGQYLYTLPSCVDDMELKITHVIRGEDHVTNTAVQIELIRALKGEPPAFAHHSLLIGADGHGLSKRFGALSIEAMRDDGLEAAAITSHLAKLGTSDPVVPESDLDRLAEGFDFAKMGRAPARFDMAELEAINARLLHETDYESVSDRLDALGVSKPLWDVVRGNILRLDEAAEWRDVVEGEINPDIEDAAFLKQAAELVPDDPLTGESWAQFTSALKEKTGVKGKNLFMPLRIALTGRARGPEMALLFPLIGSVKARSRLAGDKS